MFVARLTPHPAARPSRGGSITSQQSNNKRKQSGGRYRDHVLDRVLGPLSVPYSCAGLTIYQLLNILALFTLCFCQVFFFLSVGKTLLRMSALDKGWGTWLGRLRPCLPFAKHCLLREYMCTWALLSFGPLGAQQRANLGRADITAHSVKRSPVRVILSPVQFLPTSGSLSLASPVSHSLLRTPWVSGLPH